MSRLPFLPREALGPDGARLWDGIVETRGATATNDAGGLIGPFNAWVTAPGVGARLSSLGATLRFETSIDRRLLEVAIITTGAHWKAEFEWWAHSRMAREHGVSDEVVDAIGRGEDPPFAQDDERVVYEVARQLSSTGRVDDTTYAAACGLLGDNGMVELVSLCGYYVLVSFTLNAFEVGLPPGVTPAFSS